MLGAIIGDIAGSQFERKPDRIQYYFSMFSPNSKITDDTIMTCAIAKAILDCNGDYSELGNAAIDSMQELGRKYPNYGYGSAFNSWINSNNPTPYNSYGNGSAMRISPIPYIATSKDELITLVNLVTTVTHNHEEGIKGAEALAVAMYMLLKGYEKGPVESYIHDNYYSMSLSYNELLDKRPFKFSCTCEDTVPLALMAFFDSVSFEDAIRKAVILGGDTDTIAAMCGSLAEVYYGITDDLINKAIRYLPPDLNEIYFNYKKYIKGE